MDDQKVIRFENLSDIQFPSFRFWPRKETDNQEVIRLENISNVLFL